MARIIQLSDIHFGGEHPVAVAGAAAFIHAQPFDLLLITGDITAFGSRDEFKTAGVWFKSLPEPKLFTPGNHDTPWFGIVDRLFYPFARYAHYFGPHAAAAFETSAMKVQALNTSRGWQIRTNWSKGEVVGRQASRAIDGLGAPDGALRVIACHHPLTEITGGPMTGNVRGGRRAAERFAAAGVDLILSGHVHVPFAHPLPFGDGRTYSVGCGTLSLRERGFVPSFNVIDTDAACVRVTAMGWTGGAFEAQKTWSLDRRTQP